MKFGILIGVAATSFLMVLFCGTPYALTGAVWCTYGGEEDTCLPPVRCTYVGWQGHREMRFNDGTDCPLVLFLPSRIHGEAAPAPIPPMRIVKWPVTATPSREKQLPYGPGGPVEPPARPSRKVLDIPAPSVQITGSDPNSAGLFP